MHFEVKYNAPPEADDIYLVSGLDRFSLFCRRVAVGRAANHGRGCPAVTPSHPFADLNECLCGRVICFSLQFA